jgi:catechol 2,3-dioxygenase-like lactoylglutathione lyase family enzyme
MSQARAQLDDLIVAPHHTALSVEDFGAARDFFVTVLGFELEGEMDRRTDIAPVVALPDACVRWAMLNRGGYRLELFKYYSPDGERHGRSQSDRGFTHIALEVSDVDEAYRRVTALGLRTTCPPKILRGGLTKVIYLLGPEDNVIELIELPGRKSRAPHAGKDA